MVINPGELNKKIIIKKEGSITTDSDGFVSHKASKVVRTCWASVSNVSSTTDIAGMSKYEHKKKKFIVRWTPATIRPGMFVQYNNTDYEIESAESYHDNKEYIEIIADVHRREGAL